MKYFDISLIPLTDKTQREDLLTVIKNAERSKDIASVRRAGEAQEILSRKDRVFKGLENEKDKNFQDHLQINMQSFMRSERLASEQFQKSISSKLNWAVWAAAIAAMGSLAVAWLQFTK